MLQAESKYKRFPALKMRITFFLISRTFSFFHLSTQHFLPIFFSAHKVLSPQIVFGIIGQVTTLSKGWYVLPCVFQLSSLTPQFKPLSLSISPTNRSNWYIDCYYCLYVYMQKTVSAPFSFLLPSLDPTFSPFSLMNMTLILVRLGLNSKSLYHQHRKQSMTIVSQKLLVSVRIENLCKNKHTLYISPKQVK